MQRTIPRPLAFDHATLPWLDQVLRELDTYLSLSEPNAVARAELRGQLLHFMHYGYVILPRAVEHSLIDAYLADVYDLFDQRKLNVVISTHYHSYMKIKDWPGGDYYQHGLRITDFHNSSVAAKKLSMHPQIVRFLSAAFREQIVLMQSLTFMKGTQQEIHQDFAYVIAEKLSHMCAAWVALEDIDPKSGPLCYYPGSHMNPIFDWGDGMIRTPNSTKNDHQFAEHIHEQARAAGQQLQTFTPRKGDVLIWHGALAHGGTLAEDKQLTRKSYVTHYSTKSGFTHDYRAPDKIPVADDYNGGLIFRHPHHPEDEDFYKRGQRV